MILNRPSFFASEIFVDLGVQPGCECGCAGRAAAGMGRCQRELGARWYCVYIQHCALAMLSAGRAINGAASLANVGPAWDGSSPGRQSGLDTGGFGVPRRFVAPRASAHRGQCAGVA